MLIIRTLLATAAVALQITAASAANENVTGKWTGLVSLPLVPSSGAVLKNGKVLLWSADGEFSFGSAGRVQTTLFDPANLSNVKQTASVGHNMFCTGTTMLADGRLLVNGGSNAPVTSIYDPESRSFTRMQDMVIPRGYNGNTILADGSVLTIGGSWSNATGRKDGEIWTPSGGWRRAPGIIAEGMTSPNDSSTTGVDSHFVVIPGGNGRVLYAAPHPTMRWIDTSGSGSVKVAAQRGDDDYATSGNALMYDTGRILKTGGSPTYSGSAASAKAYEIDIRTGAPAVTKLAPMIYPRAYHNTVVLPDGRVMLIGGQTYAQSFSDSNSVLPTEVWDPKTGLFSATAPIAVGRNYHSIALLLPDGRVLSGGGGLCGSCSANHPDLQLYSPGYLFDAAGNPASRPTIVSAPDELGFGRPISVTTSRAVTSFSLVRMGATTHTVNTDQRRLSLNFTRLSDTSYRVDVPSNSGYLLPGYWMLFALDSAGVPSVAKIVRVGVNGVATMVAPEAVAGRAGSAVSIQPNVQRLADDVRFSAAGLPSGLTVNALTGAISGAPSAAGDYFVSLIATRGDQSVSTDFTMSIESAPSGGDGLTGQYFANSGLTGSPVLTRREAVNFDFGTAGPGSGVPGVFSARWTGKLRAARGGVTRFRTQSDDGVRLWIDGKLVVDNWTAHSPTYNEGQVELRAGADHDVFLEYFNSGGGGVMRLAWLRPGDGDFSAVPASELFSGAAPAATNLALGKPTVQSSQFEGGSSNKAVDGNTNGVWSSGSVTHTNLEDNPWWQVDLSARSALDFVRIWKRTDCCADRAQNLTVFASQNSMVGRSLADLAADPSVIRRSFGGSTIPNFIDVPVNAGVRYVRVQANTRNYLQIAELEAFGAPLNGAPTISAPASRSVATGDEVSLLVAASDPDGDALTFSASSLPPGLAIRASDGVISGSPTEPGNFASVVTVSDPFGLTASASIEWSVARGAPRVTAFPVKPAEVGAAVSYVPTIVNAEGATFSWSFGDGAPDAPPSLNARIRHTYARAGVFNASLMIVTPDGRRASYFFDQAVYAPSESDMRGAASGASGYEDRSGQTPRLWVANPDADSVAVINIDRAFRVAEIKVGKSPQSVLVRPDGKVWVANRDSATISVIDAATLKVERTIALPAASRPFGLALVAGGQVVVTLEALGQAMLLGPDGAIYGAADVGPTPRHVTASAQKSKIYVSRFITAPLPGEETGKVAKVGPGGAPVGGEVRIVTLTGAVERVVTLAPSDQVDTEASGRGVPNYLGAAAITPDGASAWIPSKQDNVFRGVLRDRQDLNFENSVRAIVSRIDLASGREDLASRIDVDNSGVVSAVAVHPTGAYLFAALQTSREVAVLDPAGRREVFRFPVGRAPSSLVLSPDGRKLFVGNFMDRTVTIVSLDKLLLRGAKAVDVVAEVSTIGRERLAANVLLGKQIFYDAADPRVARDGYMSCASCHDNGEADGRTWDFTGFGEGLRNTTSLLGKGGMRQGFLHWTGNFDEVQDFEGQIREFAGGTGLMEDEQFFAGTRSEPRGDRKAGVSPELDALAAYLASLKTAPQSPYAAPNGALTSRGAAGLATFDALGCGSCHGGPALTISGGLNTLRDVGTIKKSSGRRLGRGLSGLDVPTLRGVWATAPYLHDGSAPTLEAAVKAHNTFAGSDADATRVVDYLREIGAQ